MRDTLLLGILLFVSYSPLRAEENSKPEFPCYTVHARYTLYGDGTRVLWPVGSKRLLTVVADRVTWGLEEKLGPDHRDEALYGDFRVCPQQPERAGTARAVRIASWSHLRYGPRPSRDYK